MIQLVSRRFGIVMQVHVLEVNATNSDYEDEGMMIIDIHIVLQDLLGLYACWDLTLSYMRLFMMILEKLRAPLGHLDVLVGETHVADFSTGLAASVCVTVLSELGDKSFFMAAILAMHHSRMLTFLGSIMGHLIMTGVAVGLGMVVSLVPIVLTKWVSCFCMTFFGFKMLREGFLMPLDEEESLCNQNDNIHMVDRNTTNQIEYIENCDSREILCSSEIDVCRSNSEQSSNSTQGVLMQAFTLSFLGEWGDRSQIATILLASNENPYGVAVGSIFGHVMCSIMAVVCGRLIGQKFPVKTMTQVGGLVFLLCAASAIVFE